MKQKLLYICLMILCALAWSGEVWGQWSSGQGVYKDNAWYVLYETTESNVYTIASKEYSLLGPGTTLRFDAKREPTSASNLKVDKYVNGSYTGSPFFNQNPGSVASTFLGIETKINYVSYGPFDVSNATKIKFYTETGATLHKYFKNIKVPMAQYINNPSATTLAFGNNKVDEDETKSITIAWCNVPAMTTSVTGTNKDDVEVTITNNSEAGKYNTATVNVKYKRKIAGSLNATLNIANTYGSYSKSITLTGSATKYDQSISWDNEGSINTNLKVTNTQNISATATSGLGVTYSSNNTGVLTVNSSTGAITAVGAGSATITATQNGNYKYNAASSITKTFSVTKNANTLTVSDRALKVDGTDVGYTNNTKNSNAPVKCEITDENYTNESQNNGTGVISYDPETNTITALNAGTATLRIYQDANTAYESVDRTLTVSVTKYDQTLNWTNSYEKNIVVGTTVSGAAAVTASSNLTAITYSSSNAAIASVNSNGDVTGVSASNDDVTITATQPGNYKFNPVSATRDFHVIKKQEATFTVSGLTGTDPTIYVGDTPTITIANTVSDFTYTSSDETVVGIEKDGNVITLTALKVGTSTITLDQPENSTHSHVSATYNITVSKVANTLGVTLAAASNAQVDGTVNVSFTGQNSDADILAAITDTLSSTVNNGEHVVSYNNGVITAQNAGVAWITFTQAPTNQYEGFTSIRYKVTVTKHSNPITITLAGGSSTNIKLKYNATATLSYSSAHSTSSITVSRTSGNYSTYANGTITAGTAQGTDIYAITQDETYKYEAGYASFTIRVNNTDEAVGYVLYDLSEYHHGAGEGTIHKYDLSGPGNVVSYKAWRWPLAIYYDFYVQYSVTGNDNDWHELENNHNVDDSGEPSQDHTCPDTIPEDARYLRFYLPAGGTSRKLVKDVKVTRKTYLRASSNKTSFGTVYTDVSPKPTATITVNYSSVNGGDINISSNNSNFVPSVSKLDVEVNKKDPTNTYVSGVDGTQTFTVTYNPNPNSLGDETAVITISDLFNTQQITLTATAAKHENTLAVIGTQSLMVDDEVSNVYSSKNSTATLNYTLSRDGVITYNPSTNKIKAVGEGNVTLTFSQAENDYYFGASKTVTVNVSKYDQTLSWDNDLDGAARTLEVGDHLFTNTATATSGLSVTYSSSNASALEVNASTGELIAKAGGSNIAITATQVGNYKYNEAVSITRYFTVISRIDAVVTTTLAEDVTNNFPIGNPDITIGCNATITESALTITGNAGGIISSSFANNTFTIRALKEGTVTLTLTRAQDEGYNSLNKSYTIQVVKPVVVLQPTEAPVFSYEEYSSVTLNRTLKSGYSTIALPFNTTVEDIVGNDYDSTTDWVAQLSVVTYNAQDGYSLYFEKKSDIVANQPYILHLGSAVNSPVFTNVSVVAAATASQNATKGVNLNKWTMYSNYTPGFVMEGYYGIAGEKIKKGTVGATLSAFRAYIEGPADPLVQVKTAYLDNDEADGILELLKGEGTGTESVYDLQGRQLPRAGRGINIIRNADGSVRKVLRK